MNSTKFPMRIALIPAHNEAEGIAASIQGLYDQTVRPERVVVVADNCTDNTAEIALSMGAEVFTTYGNLHKKAGGLNQALDLILPTLDDEDLILVQDGDTVLVSDFLEHAQGAFTRRVGAVGGIFLGESGGGLLGLLQRMEYARYAEEIGFKKGKAAVLTGTGTVFRAQVLREVLRARRDGKIPGGLGVYSLASLTEDDEITKAIKTLGYRCVSPAGCIVTTEVMETVPKLWNQRMRWQYGALKNLQAYGWTKVTRPYILRQIAMGLGALALFMYFVLVGWMLAVHAPFTFHLFWTSITAIFVIEKVVTVSRAGWRAQIVAGLIVVELMYDVFQHAVFFKSLFNLVMGRKEAWHAT